MKTEKENFQFAVQNIHLKAQLTDKEHLSNEQHLSDEYNKCLSQVSSILFRIIIYICNCCRLRNNWKWFFNCFNFHWNKKPTAVRIFITKLGSFRFHLLHINASILQLIYMSYNESFGFKLAGFVDYACLFATLSVPTTVAVNRYLSLYKSELCKKMIT